MKKRERIKNSGGRLERRKVGGNCKAVGHFAFKYLFIALQLGKFNKNSIQSCWSRKKGEEEEEKESIGL